MSLLGRSLLDIQSLTESNVLSLFETAQRIRHLHQTNKIDFGRFLQANGNKYAALVFLEPSTRTRASFEVAAYKLGIQVLCPEFGGSSSRSKGESLVDTVKTIAAMDPDVMVVRYGTDSELDAYLQSSVIPVVNGGSGVSAHPTQALLDSFTIAESLEEVKGQNVLIVGDIKHSRVARSNIKLLKILGANIGVCGPDEFMANDISGVERFPLAEGIEWASVIMALRIQLERHEKDGKKSYTQDDYHRDFGLTKDRLKKFGAGIVMHPGPINQGVEMTPDVLKDPRCRVLIQVKNGVYIRAAVMSQILGIKV